MLRRADLSLMRASSPFQMRAAHGAVSSHVPDRIGFACAASSGIPSFPIFVRGVHDGAAELLRGAHGTVGSNW